MHSSAQQRSQQQRSHKQSTQRDTSDQASLAAGGSPQSELRPKPTSDPPRRHILTFNARAGRSRPKHMDALEQLLPRYEIGWDGVSRLDVESLYGRKAPLILEIGSGNGEATAALAEAEPERDILAVEIYPQGIANLMLDAQERGLDNIRIYQGDAIPLMHHAFGPGSLAGVRVYFPDPWPKKRHHKRRIIQPDHVARMAELLEPGGTLHAATDWAEYAHHMLRVLQAEERLENTSAGFTPRPDFRPMTKFERRGIDAGHEIFDLIFQRR
ncbi:tRNA (guanosine(46)-N7)-methyltransferase TrmB [Natronoglycomyces albus]|uniref:tRNA (guanine-N(7)-)-methyltransferase n=1 Tax=Natronoglycomyces albus TaxID=2811108 RepID=A0A895XUL4_9ACTN|nr:tRNA (guanosine(46)-N7)-methyltransferase TrmB [Natronoglycomyces albus]QSB05920.1 tRNA (guanosine(46)-N7)-methyltransferase TrmB [Natronoglycomyces albus]